MRIREIEIDRRGSPTGVRLERLSPGLNVVVAQSRGDCAALLTFLRGLLCRAGCSGFGSADAETDRPAGGRIAIDHDGCTYSVRRVVRPGHGDTFALCSVGRASDHATAFRHAWREAAHEPLLSLFLSSLDHPFPAEQAPKWAEANAQRAVARAGDLRAAADACAPRPTALRAAEQRCEHLQREAAVLLTARQRRQRSYAAELQQVRRALETAEADIVRLDEDWQAAVSDLRDEEDRLWSPMPVVPSSIPVEVATRHDAGADHIRQVLKDLAERRRQLSVALAELAGGPPTARPHAARAASVRAETERLRIDRCEAELWHQLQCLPAAHLASTATASGDEQQAVPASMSAAHVAALAARCIDRAAPLATAREQHLELLKRRDRLERERRRAAAERTLDLRRFALAVARQQLASLQQDQAAAELYRTALEQCAPAPQSLVEWTAAASRRLATLSAGCWLRVERTADGTDWRLADDQGNWHRLADCPPAAIEQAALSLRLALVAAARQCSSPPPVVWRDLPAGGSDEDTLVAGRLLSATAGLGVQVVIVTDRRRVAELLAECGGLVHELPEIEDCRPPAGEAIVVQELEDSRASPAPGDAVEHLEEVPSPVRVHPAAPHWLTADRGLQEVPSIGPQMARRLRGMGVFDVGDLLTLNLADSRFLLSELQLTADQVRLWQAEAELLCRVPDLTGRDAQLLVCCGILTVEELAGHSASDLALRIDRLRGGAATRWLPEVGVWPRRETVLCWIHAARRARHLETALSEGDHWGIRRRRQRRVATRTLTTAASGPGPAVRQEHDSPPLDRDSPLADAPSIGRKTAKLLERIGVVSVADLLTCDAAATAARLRHPRLSVERLRTWQRQTALLCTVPGLRPSDARLLVACGVHGREDLQRIAPSTLFAVLGPVLRTPEGQRLLRGDPPPTPADAARWIEASHRAAVPRAA